MTMKTIELHSEMTVSAAPATTEPSPMALGLRAVATRWLGAVRVALTRYVAHNDAACDRMAAEQARDPNRQ